uniref:Zinc finger C2H2 type n=1 Tax=Echinococcus granulosus TaxID=6210 RepID=A0A068WNG6_ECHGR|nr:zinc finger C2H2 type [Echinococcus granulosus]
MTDTNNGFPPDASAVFALMKSFSDQQLPMPLTSVDGNDLRDTDDLKNRLLAAAMSMLNASTINPSAWPSEAKIPTPNSKPDFEANWDEMNLTSQFFSGLATPSSEATTSTPGDFPFPNPFMMIPPSLQSMGTKGLPAIVNGNKDEDFCELCQKHFCNKYYLRKHKNDVHRIPSEPFSQIRKREAGSNESDDNDPTDKSPCTNTNEWMNVLTSSAATAQQLGESIPNRRTPVEGFRSISNPAETNVTSEKEQVSLWMPKSERKPSRVELGENATFIPPVVASDSVSSPTLSSAVTSKALNAGALDMFKSSMAAAKLADRVTCDLCKKELCNKYFLRTHKIKVHGLSPQEVGVPISRASSGKHTEKIQVESTSQSLETFGVPPPLPPPLSLMTPMLPSQFPAPLGSLPAWLPPQPPSVMPDMPRPPQEEAKKDPVSQLMAANALVTCPLCDKTIGPRLFLPTHLTSVHSLSPTDPSFFIFILSARTLDNNGESDASTAKMTPTSNSDRESPTSTAIQLPNPSLMRLPSATSVENINREQSGIPQLSVPNTMNGILPPAISMHEVGIEGGGFDLPVMATASNTLLLPPPLGLLSPPSGLYSTPPAIQPPPPPAPPTAAVGMVINPAASAATTTKWNPVHLAASGLAAKRILPNGTTGTTPRKSPNQMRVLCDICNKWICNKYFLRTHKANKHGITNQTVVITPTSQATGSAAKGIAVVPLDFSKPGKIQQQQPPSGTSEGTSEFFPMGVAGGKEDASAIHPPIMASWSFTNSSPHSPLPRSPHILSAANESANPPGIQDTSVDRGCPLNLSLKPSPHRAPGVEIKHGVDQFLANFPTTNTPRWRRIKIRRRNLRLQKGAARVLARACRQLFAFYQTSSLLRRHTTVAASLQNEAKRGGAGKNASRPWQNACRVCSVCFNKRSQLGAHCYANGHPHVLRVDVPTPVNIFRASTGIYTLPADSAPQNSMAQIASDCSMDETGGWWARQQKWPINFVSAKLTSHQSPSSNSTAPEQFCSYQASHHLIQPPLFNETTTTPTI